jgi:hypothetical protein
MVWNSSTFLYACITYATTSSIGFDVLVCVVGFSNPFADDPISYTNVLPNPNFNGCPFVDPSILIGTCSSGGLNIAKASCVSTLSMCSPLVYKPSCVCCYWCCKWCCKCWKCCGLLMVSIQSSYMVPSKFRCSSPSKNLRSYSLLTFYLYFYNCLFCGDSSMVFLHFVWLFVPLLALQMVPFCPSSLSMPLLMCSHVPS